MTRTVRAAGGLIWRPGPEGPEVLLVHRPRYDDWSFPKGKCAEEESDVACANREVGEETGLRCRLGDELPSARYVDGKGRPKVVRYWEMRPTDGEFTPNQEVDEVQWIDVARARAALSYDHDREVLDALVALLGEAGR